MASTTLLPPDAATAAVDLPDTSAGPVLDLTIAGLLDERAGRALLQAVDRAAAEGWHRVEVDLREVVGHTAEGVAAVATLCRRGSHLPAGIGFSVASGPSRAALLAALADV